MGYNRAKITMKNLLKKIVFISLFMGALSANKASNTDSPVSTLIQRDEPKKEPKAPETPKPKAPKTPEPKPSPEKPKPQSPEKPKEPKPCVR
ncbi:MAG: hypothetical protein LBN27_09900 [Prevotellaceae bacterium]|jgi:outer membrane biosynthesis protein TonB|nr:hypothetical protein [Prevotellaceae bacterium]